MSKSKLGWEKLAPYLPFKVKCYANGSFYGVEMLCKELDCYLAMNLINDDTVFKLGLRPLSDLTKEVYFDGNTIRAIDYISTSIKDSQKTMRRVAHKLPLDNLEYWKIERLLKLHFDVFNLIPKGLAIDINTLN